MKMKFKDNYEQNSEKNFIDPHDFWDMVDDQMGFYLNSPSSHFDIERAKNEGWLGWKDNNKCKDGLLGYMRTNIACQLKVLNKLGNFVPIYISEFVSFFNSSYFKDSVLKSGNVSFSLHPQMYNGKRINYLDIVKAKSYTVSNDFDIKNFNTNNLI